ncbi:undecaprenyl-diphosphate phosphatase [Streptococcus mutans]|uniref:undecaprenyl-diphosphate phosphatase n=1 Tax=Streptococcus mutans TaxID=1309 RepID=UPI0002B539B5|nr:undecaprenyl-diphosphate phosphatase [Streptococcus mutans]EMC56243.1 undecaprenyl pyrophosphate phosphatase [Streptococcus mutans M230]EMP69169.1 undecaprenyl pyrophosphate phosphatase [Streptococcus mutans NCTC 11060]MCB4957088.1 undecaprenyl-diphosphate phosphatase [Streptococcus mutans]MDT9553784.1 undecaprenyl-diphosphate phosphatase [Streptococcus mutans]MDT9573912.1 undecaprenyl-diphosphate phosphatase [Streptococcus mutans]
MLFFEIIKAIIFGIVEGITEWLPISSTGHLILVEEFIHFNNANAAFTNMFNVVIQLGAILAVVVIYFDRLNPFKNGKTEREVQITWQLWAKVILSALPAAVIGLIFDDWLDTHFQNFFSVALMLILYGIAFIYVERRHQGVEPQVTHLVSLPYKTAFFIGLFQVLSLIPGTSRSGATILGGILLGTSRQVATEFTFFLGIPIMFGASLVKVLKFIVSGTILTGSQLFILLVAMLVAFAVSLYVIRFLTDYVKNHDFTFFGKYRIGLGILLLFYGLMKVLFG